MVFCSAIPAARRFAVHTLPSNRHARQDHLRSPGRVISACTHALPCKAIAFASIPEALWNIPVIANHWRSARHSAREFSVRVQFFIEHVEGFIPAHAHKTVIPRWEVSLRWRLRSQSTRTIGNEYAPRCVHDPAIRRSFSTVFIQFERFCCHKATLLHRRAIAPQCDPVRMPSFEMTASVALAPQSHGAALTMTAPASRRR